MTPQAGEELSQNEVERFKKLRRKNKILALAIGAFALAMVILSYLMFSHYKFVPYE
jgi:flagellar biosynthesis/type III secretory pathway M-ring protein FliF/YscJ